MRRLLTTRTWLVRLFAGLVLAAAFVTLGLWQLDRNEQRQERNAILEENLNRDPLPIDAAAGPQRPLDPADEWSTVRVSGRYDVENQLVIRLRPLGGQPGVHVLTPLVTDDGGAVLVDRGFVPAPGADIPELPAPPDGVVEVVGRARVSEQGRGPGGDPSSGSIRYVDLDELGGVVPHPLYGTWLEALDERPAPAQAPERVPPPEIDAGPHLSYAIQWFLFTVIGVGGFILLIRAEAKARREDAAAEAHDPAAPATPGAR